MNETVEHSDGWHVARNGTCIRIRSRFDAIWMGEIEAGLFERWLGLYPPFIAIHFADIALNHMNLRVPLPVSYFHWLSWIVPAIPFPWGLSESVRTRLLGSLIVFCFGFLARFSWAISYCSCTSAMKSKLSSDFKKRRWRCTISRWSWFLVFSFDFKFQYFEYYTMRMRSVANWAKTSSFWRFQRKSVAGCTVGVSCSSWLLHTSLPALAAQGCLFS